MNRLKLNFASLYVGIFISLFCSMSVNAVCPPQKMFNPVSDMNWNNMFPITIAGVKVGSNMNPPAMYEPPVCLCPGRLFGTPTPGVGITYWEPLFIAEIAQDAGCMSTIGGVSMLSSYGLLSAGYESHREFNRLQVHWYEYPVFAIIEMFSDMGCFSSSGFALGYMTELDSAHQNDLWAARLSPEIALFANQVAVLSCIPDAIASSLYFPIDPLYWCAGATGTVMPFSGSTISFTSSQKGNLNVLYRFMAKMHRIMMLNNTIGPQALCFSSPAPIWIKSQYRIDPITPIPINRDTMVIGQSEMRWGLAPPANYATREDSAFLIWVGKQCCARF